MNQLVILQGQLAEKTNAIRALSQKTDIWTLEEKASFDTLKAEAEAVKGQLEIAKVQADAAIDAKAYDDFLNKPVAGLELATTTATPGTPGAKKFTIPAAYKRFQPQHIKADAEDGITATENAYRIGMWFLATLGRNQKAAKWCQEHGMELKAQSESVASGGGFLVPDPLEQTLIDLRELYGVFRKHARRRVMTADTKRITRRTGGLTTYWVGDNGAITDSTKAWDQITLTAKKLATLTYYSSELNEDAIIDIADDLAYEIGWAFSQKEDQCGFIGDGTSTYAGMIGATQKLLGLSGTISQIAGLIVASGTGYGTNYASIALADFNQVVGLLPQYADQPGNCGWYCHRTFWANTMQRLALAAGGVTAQEVMDGASTPVFLGYPVFIAQVMPQFSAVSQVCALFGNLAMGASFGDRRETTIALSEHVGFANDQIAIRGTERFDIVVHDVGNASGTASLKVTGPIVGLVTAAS